MRRRITLSVLLTMLALLPGCSSGVKTLPTATLNGEVKKMSGEVFGNVTVVFYPAKGPTATAKTNDAGMFSATVTQGACRVAIVSQASATTTDTSPNAIEAAEKENQKFNSRFNSPDTSGLTTNVAQTQKDKVVFVVE